MVQLLVPEQEQRTNKIHRCCAGGHLLPPCCPQVVYGLIRERRQEMASAQVLGAPRAATRTDLLHSLLTAKDEDGSGKYVGHVRWRLALACLNGHL
jgi:hypothetical protein